MEWTEVSIYTSTEGVELLCGKLLEIGINGFAVEDALDFQEFLEETTPHWDYVDDSLMGLKDAETRVIVYLPKMPRAPKHWPRYPPWCARSNPLIPRAAWAVWRFPAKTCWKKIGKTTGNNIIRRCG